MNGIAKSLSNDEVGGDRGEAWESTPGDGARDACALYVKTQMKLLRHAMVTERDEEEPKVRGILGEKRDRDDDSSDSDIWDHDSDGTGSREDDCSEDELYEKIADLPPRGWW